MAKAYFTVSQADRVGEFVKWFEAHGRNSLSDRQKYDRFEGYAFDPNSTSSSSALTYAYVQSTSATATDGAAIAPFGTLSLSPGSWLISGVISAPVGSSQYMFTFGPSMSTSAYVAPSTYPKYAYALQDRSTPSVSLSTSLPIPSHVWDFSTCSTNTSVYVLASCVGASMSPFIFYVQATKIA